MGTILVTDVTQYAGPGAVAALVAQGWRVVCHDRTFHADLTRRAFIEAHPGVECAESVDAADLASELVRRNLEIDAVVLNSSFSNRPAPIG